MLEDHHQLSGGWPAGFYRDLRIIDKFGRAVEDFVILQVLSLQMVPQNYIHYNLTLNYKLTFKHDLVVVDIWYV